MHIHRQLLFIQIPIQPELFNMHAFVMHSKSEICCRMTTIIEWYLHSHRHTHTYGPINAYIIGYNDREHFGAILALAAITVTATSSHRDNLSVCNSKYNSNHMPKTVSIMAKNNRNAIT